MNISSVSHQATSVRPQAPSPPPGGNIENRQPPAEPSAPANVNQATNASQQASRLLDIYV